MPNPWDLVLDEIGSGKAQAALGGMWVPSMYLGRGQRYTPFAQVSNRAPLALIGRESAAGFEWAKLAGKVVSMQGSNGASVGLFLKLVMRDNGVDPASVHFIQDLDGAMLATLFKGGMADYLVIGAPSALALAAKGGGHVVSLLTQTGGDVPWSVYYAPGESGPERLDMQTRFVRALGRSMDWVLARPAAEYQDFLAQTFPRFDPALLAPLIDIYRSQGMWTTPRIGQASHDRWQRGIAAGHLIGNPIAYAALIDQRPTAAVGAG